jgi:hypothetical protein
MLYAVKHGKIDRSLYKANEDALTSSIFEKLNYLPTELFLGIIDESIIHFPFKLRGSTLNELSFWPRWSHEKLNKYQFREPDLFIKFEDFDLIIEAKRDDNNQQNQGQWQEQIKSYKYEYREDNKPLYFIALGGVWSESTGSVPQGDDDIKIYKCRWNGLLETIRKYRDKLEHSAALFHSNQALTNILDDLILSFSLFGFFTGEWFEKFPSSPGIDEESLKTINSWSPSVKKN